MMKKKEITVETHQVTVIRRRSAHRAWCAACAQSVPMVSAEEAAALLGLTVRKVYRLVETDGLHFTETREGWLRLCLDSIQEAKQRFVSPERQERRAKFVQTVARKEKS